MTSTYGGVNYSGLSIVTSLMAIKGQWFLNLIVAIIYSFHMPLFFALSGALFTLQRQNGRFQSFFELIKIKAKRLIAPYFLVSIFFMVPIKFISNFYDSSILCTEIINGIVLALDNGHLWFLPTLFWVFIVAWLLETYVRPMLPALVPIIVILIFLFGEGYVSGFGIEQVPRYLFWFYLGIWFEHSREKVNTKILKHKILFIVVALFLFSVEFPVVQTNSTIAIVVTFLGICLTYFICLALRNLARHPVVQRLDYYCFDIYLYHDPLNYLILYLTFSIFQHMWTGLHPGWVFLAVVASRILITLASRDEAT